MLNVLKDETAATVRDIVSEICAKYPATFKDVVGSSVYGNGIDSMAASIYNCLGYQKKRRSTCTPRANSNDQSENDSDDEEMRARETRRALKRKQDEYGCVEYSPVLPEGETEESQEEKRKQLLDLSSQPDCSDVEVIRLMSETYPSQRALIIAKDRDISSIFNDWPVLTKWKYLIVHADRLLGKDLNRIWSAFLEGKGGDCRQFLKTKIKKKDLLKLITRDYKNACEAQKSKLPKAIGIFQLLLANFKEESAIMFQLVDVRYFVK